MRKNIRRMAILVLLVAAGIVTAAAPAQANYVLRGHFQNWQTGACLDSNQTVYTLPCQQGNDYQTWTVTGPLSTKRGTDQVQIRNVATGRCLAMQNYGGLWLNVEGCTTTELSGISLNQILDGVGPNWNNVQLRAYYKGELCVDTHRVGEAYANYCNYGRYQTWRLIWR